MQNQATLQFSKGYSVILTFLFMDGYLCILCISEIKKNFPNIPQLPSRTPLFMQFVYGIHGRILSMTILNHNFNFSQLNYACPYS